METEQINNQINNQPTVTSTGVRARRKERGLVPGVQQGTETVVDPVESSMMPRRFRKFFDYRYLTDEQLKGFDRYKYSSQDTSPLSNYVMHPFWNQAVKLVPTWIAPNVLTFAGFLFTVLNGIILTHYDYFFYASSDTAPEYPPIPQWVWLICAINHFLAHTLDGIDGKHARRTKTSGPLGELFDHGLDSWTALMIPFCIYSLFGRADYALPPMRVLFIFWAVFVTFYFSHWEKYNTGILYLPWSYDISQVALFSMYIITFKASHTIWKFRLPVLNWTSGGLFEVLTHLGAFGLSVPVTLYNVWHTYRLGKLKQPSLYESMRPLIPLTILFGLTIGWAFYSPSSVVDRDPRAFYVMLGTIYSNIACRLIVTQMSSTRCETLNWLLVPLSITILLIFLVPSLAVYEIPILHWLTAFVILAHIHYGICVVRQMSQHFGIYAFLVGRRSTYLSASSSPSKQALTTNVTDIDDPLSCNGGSFETITHPAPSSSSSTAQYSLLRNCDDEDFEKDDSELEIVGSSENERRETSMTVTVNGGTSNGGNTNNNK